MTANLFIELDNTRHAINKTFLREKLTSNILTHSTTRAHKFTIVTDLIFYKNLMQQRFVDPYTTIFLPMREFITQRMAERILKKDESKTPNDSARCLHSSLRDINRRRAVSIEQVILCTQPNLYDRLFRERERISSFG